MTATAAPRRTQDSQWFASWFDSPYYHRLYAHRDEAEATRFVNALVETLQPKVGADALDLGCGAGRHAKQLAAHGLRVTGMDLSAGSIVEARRFEHQGLRFRRHDMRRPFGKRSFDYVFNFFTSFGYFENETEHMSVVRNMSRALRTGGRLVLDYLNVQHAAGHLRRGDCHQIDGVTYRVTRWTSATHFFKQILIEDPARKAPLEYVERVARIDVHDFGRLLTLNGLAIDDVYGDYGMGPYDVADSPRLILVARKVRDVADYFRERALRTLLSVSGVSPRYDATIH